MTRKVQCPRCGYTWVTRSTREYVTCPNCQRKVKPIELERRTEPSEELLQKLKREVVECINKNQALKIVREGEPCIRLSSGKLSLYYLDLRKVLFRDIECLRKIAEAIITKIKLENVPVDYIACKALGVVPLAVTLSLMLNKPLIVLRERMKDYGLGGRVVGPIDEIRDKNVLVVDDVATTGNTLLEVIDVVEQHGGKVSKVIVVVDRLEGAAERLRERGYTLDAILTRRDLGIPDELVVKAVEICKEAIEV